MAGADKGANDQLNSPFFLEAHYYSAGLRHHVFANGGKRPSWAPAPDSVGFRDEFVLEHDDAAIEFQRRNVSGNRVTWVGVYYRSIDEKLGDRQNYAGIGVWANELVIVDAKKLLNALMQFAGKIAGGGNPVSLAKQAAGFLSDRYLPKYLAPISGFPPELSGCPFSRSELATLGLFEAIGPSQEMSWDVAADAIVGMGVSREGKYTHSRALIRLPASGKASDEKGRFEALTEDTDVLSDFVSEIPGVVETLSSRAVSLERKAEQLNIDLSESQARAFALETERNQLEERLVAKEGEFASLISPQLRPEPFPQDVRRQIEDIKRKTDEISFKIDRFQTTIRNTAVKFPNSGDNFRNDPYIAMPSKNVKSKNYNYHKSWFDFGILGWAVIFAFIFVLILLIYVINNDPLNLFSH